MKLDEQELKVKAEIAVLQKQEEAYFAEGATPADEEENNEIIDKQLDGMPKTAVGAAHGRSILGRIKHLEMVIREVRVEQTIAHTNILQIQRTLGTADHN